VALREFIDQHRLPARDAEEELNAALRRAGEENKRVFLHQSGSDSYPSRLLARFVHKQRELLDRDYVYVNIDPSRTTNGNRVFGRYRRPASSLRPWMAILDAEGMKLADSDSPQGNIGFPSEPEAIDHFIDRMLKPT